MARDSSSNSKRRSQIRAHIERSSAGLNKKWCILSMFLFFAILGIAFGVIFGVIPTDFVTDLFNGSNNDGAQNGGGEDDDGDNSNTGGDGGGEGPGLTLTYTPSQSPTSQLSMSYTFMQCPQNGECCNGLESSCDLKASEIMWPTVHNAMHDGLLGNNDGPLEDALEAGYRGLLLDVCWCDNQDTQERVLVFCHGICGLGERNFGDVISNINTFLDDNPTEIILINFEISYGNPKPTPHEIWSAMNQYDGIAKKTYIHQGGDFPTMRQLLQNSKQLLLFKHNGLNCLNTSDDGCTKRIPEFFKYAVETRYEFDSVAAIKDNYSYSCEGDRGFVANPDFYHINNFVTKIIGPSIDAAKTINERSFLEKRISECERITKFNANIVSVDFWQQGDLLEVAQEINKVRAKSLRRRSLRKYIYDWFH